ncbi:ER degradation-enhancing alpha-mannosidase-like protein 3 isoform X1 [Penaeus vannamei]|uniref:ER degradation-enhancing alpha-mannosidase-like protein 3 isoform X1 n=1 Tax=Penaeus vannamei TaxID=6689 RepID=UPI000F6762BF|nr:ER degradation-enhancing alpha-mannosidase-like protein 3 isoform X2 [Penaeus vannamei]
MCSTFYIGALCVLSASWLVLSAPEAGSQSMSEEERLNLKEEAKEMFYHAYTAYMDNAYPADELMPLSCKARWRDSEPSRGDIDETLGNFSLTLVDSLDTLVVLGDIEEFDRALRLVVRDVGFDHDLVVSVFETNIRMVGGLLSGHIMAEHLNQLYGALGWYRGELLTLAKDLATRLLPAFNTTTGIPHAKVNLKYGMKSPKLQGSRETCTACAGTIILEFAALSRLTGDPIFEEKARQAMDCLWSQRHRGSDLVGTVLNVHSGDWVRRDSGVGAGIDSYYEYLLKAYVLLGDEGYLERFNKHYSAVMKYISQGPMLLDVHMHRPHTTSRNFMDALLAFWPGLQVLKGDIKPAIETHEMLYQVIQRHNFLPEAFTTDFQVHWGQHPLRPEFLESTYLLYLATDDPYYLRVGEQVLRSLQKHAWVPCGYAAVKDVRTGVHEDRMDSFVLAETFKYLYLLFAKPSDLIIDLDQFIFTTEAHLLPLSLARLSNLTVVPGPDNQDTAQDSDVEYARSCPNAHYLFPGRHEFAETIRRPLKNFVNNVCPSRKTIKRKLRASEFQAGNSRHMGLLRDMGITIMALPDGRVQLLHTSSNAKSSDDAEEGLLFMQEMIELSKLQQEQPENPPRVVSFTRWVDGHSSKVTIQAGPAQFGLDLKGDVQVSGPVVKARHLRACDQLENEKEVRGKIVIMERGDCMFIEKARRLEALGAIGGIVLDNTPGTSATSSPMFAMSGDGTNDVSIPLVFLFSGDAEVLLKALQDNPDLEVVLSDYVEKDWGIPKDICSYIIYLEEFVFLTPLPYDIWKAYFRQLIPNGVLTEERDEVDIASEKEGSNKEGSESDHLEEGKGSVEEVEVDGKDASEGAGEAGEAGLEEGAMPQVVSIINNRHQGSESVSNDDLVTVVEGQHEEQALSVPQDEAQKNQEILKELEEAETAEEILVAAVRYVNLRQEQENAKGNTPLLDHPSSSIVTELQSLLVRKTASDPSLLRSLLSVHLRELMAVLQQATPSPADLDASIHQLLNQLSAFSTKPPQENTKKPLTTAPASPQGAAQKGDFHENRLEHLTEKIQEKIRKLKKKYEGLIPQHIEGLLSDLEGTSPPNTKDADRKDEL